MMAGMPMVIQNIWIRAEARLKSCVSEISTNEAAVILPTKYSTLSLLRMRRDRQVYIAT
jgi:hypothetical protein